jgi:hypothetical protein
VSWIDKLRESRRARKHERDERRAQGLDAERRGEIGDDRSRKNDVRDSQEFPMADNVGSGWINPPSS